jgi:predicted acylesterase/phospholipase RssA
MNISKYVICLVTSMLFEGVRGNMLFDDDLIQNGKMGQCDILAMSGGGSFGMVEVGILSGLYETDSIPQHFDIISGISAGGLNAGFLSYYNNTSLGVSDLYNVYTSITNDDVYKLNLLKIMNDWSIYDTTPLRSTLDSVIRNKTPEQYNNPYTIIGTSNVEKEQLDIYHFNTLSPEDKVNILMATSAIPIVFPPQHVNGTLYVDGGVISNEIIYEAMQYINCDFYDVLFISASSKHGKNTKVDGFFSFLSSIVKLLYHTFNYQLSEFSHNSCNQPRGMITECFPNSTQLDNYSILDFNTGKELYDIAKENYACYKYPIC